MLDQCDKQNKGKKISSKRGLGKLLSKLKFTVWKKLKTSDAYVLPCQISMMERFVKINNA